MRAIIKETTVPAPRADVWTAWTTAEGVTSFSAPQAWIELRVGGAYEWYFMLDQPPGTRGAEGCRVLAYLPERMLAFSWNAPPSIPTIRGPGILTQVVVELSDADGGGTHVRLTHHDLGEGDDWDEYVGYFDHAWGMVMDGLTSKFS